MVRGFNRATQQVAEVQREVLLNKVRPHADSDFGRRFGFRGITDVARFRESVPIADYALYHPYIEEVKKGKLGAMFGRGTRLVMFAMTSGTTREPKYIPVTREFLNDYRRGWLVWGWHVYRSYPSIINRTIFPLTSAYDEQYTGTGLPCGAISGLTSEKQNLVTRMIYTAPSCLYRVKNIDAKYYAMMRFALMRDVGSITTANPSTVLSIVRLADKRKDDLIRDIRDGGIGASVDLPSDVREYCRRRLPPAPARAAELERFAGSRGELLPRDYWPGLQVITNWKGGTLSSYLEQYPHYFGETPVRDIGLVASEGRMSIPLSDEGCGGVLDVTSHFYEFIPEDEEDSRDPAVLLAHELEEGKRYFILLTTSCGLYRYNIRDLVEVTGRYHHAPVIRFLNKGKHISSITGEKLTEFQVVEAMREAGRACAMPIDTFTAVPERSAVPGYALIVEQIAAGNVDARRRLCAEFDAALRRMNIEYDGKRASGRLAMPAVLTVRDGSFEDMKRRHIEKQKGRAEQYKHIFLVPDGDFLNECAIIERVSAGALRGSGV